MRERHIGDQPIAKKGLNHLAAIDIDPRSASITKHLHDVRRIKLCEAHLVGNLIR